MKQRLHVASSAYHSRLFHLWLSGSLTPEEQKELEELNLMEGIDTIVLSEFACTLQGSGDYSFSTPVLMQQIEQLWSRFGHAYSFVLHTVHEDKMQLVTLVCGALTSIYERRPDIREALLALRKEWLLYGELSHGIRTSSTPVFHEIPLIYRSAHTALSFAFYERWLGIVFHDELLPPEKVNFHLDGDKFFYVNPLVSKGEHHRVDWFGTSCCPTNLARFLPSIGQYAYAGTEDGFVVNQYMSSETTLEVQSGINVKLKQTTAYPWDGRIELAVNPDQADKFTIRLRVPGWCRGYKLTVQGERVSGAEGRAKNGYLVLDRQWTTGETTIVLELDMPVEIVRSRREVEANLGRIALQRGPIVYCIEQTDNVELSYEGFTLSAHEPLLVEHKQDLLGGVTVLSGKAAEGTPCIFIPYYAWDNREAGFMQVWIHEAESRHLYSY